MKVAKLSEVKNQLSKYVEAVRRGERVRIVVRGVPAADLVPVTEASAGPAAEESSLRELERRGWIRRGKGGLDPEILAGGPRTRGKPLSAIVIEERRRR
jgi:prevent-host-death family protein